MKIAVCEWCLPERGEDAVRAAAEYGFDGIEIDIKSAKGEEERRALVRAAKDAGIELCALALNLPGGAGVTHGCTDEVKRALDAAAEAAGELGVPCIQVPSFPPNDIKGGEDLALAAEALRYLCRALLPQGIKVLSENTLDAEGNLRLLAETGMPNAGVYFDTLNPVGFGFGDPAELLKKLAPVTGQAHVKDGTKGAMGKLPLGEGDGMFRECCRILRSELPGIWAVSENDYAGEGGTERLRRDVEAMRKELA